MGQNVIVITKLNYKKHFLRRAVRKKNENEFLKRVTLKDVTSILMLGWEDIKEKKICLQTYYNVHFENKKQTKF